MEKKRTTTLQRKHLYTCTTTISTHLVALHHMRMSQTPTSQFSVSVSLLILQQARQTVRYLCFAIIPSSIPCCHLADCTFIMYKYAYDIAFPRPHPLFSPYSRIAIAIATVPYTHCTPAKTSKSYLFEMLSHAEYMNPWRPVVALTLFDYHIRLFCCDEHSRAIERQTGRKRCGDVAMWLAQRFPAHWNFIRGLFITLDRYR